MANKKLIDNGTLARMAGNIADGILSNPSMDGYTPEDVAREAVKVARLIKAELETELTDNDTLGSDVVVEQQRTGEETV